MNQEIKTKWVEALRSGEYKQAQTTLRSVVREGFCCLGVLCDIVDPDAWHQHDNKTWSHGGDFAVGYPSEELLAKVGLTIEASRTLSLMNDAGNKTFRVIANYIEEKL